MAMNGSAGLAHLSEVFVVSHLWPFPQIDVHLMPGIGENAAGD